MVVWLQYFIFKLDVIRGIKVQCSKIILRLIANKFQIFEFTNNLQ